MSYETASQCFINRDFPGAHDLLGSVSSIPDIKTWMLYLALCERALIEEDTPEWPISDPDRRALRRAVLKGGVWPELSTTWQQQSDTVPSTLVMTAMILSAKHNADPEPITKFMEEYLAQKDVPIGVVDVFLTSILAELSHDFFYARELAQSAIYEEYPEKQRDLLDKISQCEQKVVEEQKRAAQLQQQRVEAAKEEQRRQEEALQASLSEDETLADLSDEKSSSATTPAHNSDSNSQLTQHGNSAQGKNVRKYRRVDLTEYFKNWVKGVLRGEGVYNAIVLFLVVLALLKNGKSRQGLRDGAVWLYRAARTGLTMALRVTYL